MRSSIQIGLKAIILALLLTAVSPASAGNSLPDFTELVQRNSAAVVNISLPEGITLESTSSGTESELPGSEMMVDALGGRSLGSGFVISTDGYVVTNNHVIQGAPHLVVRIDDHRELPARVIGWDDVSDVALLKVQGGILPAVRMGTSNDLKAGEWVVAIGSPFGFDHTVTTGVVSSKARRLPGENDVSFIQTDVPINPGNSGGPLFNLKGEVVGMNSQIYSRTGGFMGLSFAIPIEETMNVAGQLKSHGRVSRGWLGVFVQPLMLQPVAAGGQRWGARVVKMNTGGPAERGGLRIGDVVLSVDGRTIDDSATLPWLVGHIVSGQRVTLDLLRASKKIQLRLQVGEQPSTARPHAGGTPKLIQANAPRLALAELLPDDKRRLRLGDFGVRVTSADNAGFEGLREQDLLLMADGVPLQSVDDVRRLTEHVPDGRAISWLVRRGTETCFVAQRGIRLKADGSR